MRFWNPSTKSLGLLLFLVALLIAATPLSATAIDVDLTRYLSDYERTAGRPITLTDSFFGVSGPARLIITNGDGSYRRNKVTSATIELNGKRVVGPRRLRRSGGHFEVPVNLVEDNTISVRVRGKPRSFFNLRIKQEAAVDLNITGRIHFNTNVSDFVASKAFYTSIGFPVGFGFPDTNTLEVAESLGIETPTEYDGSQGPEAGGYLLHGELIALPTISGGFIDLIEFTIPRNDEPPYARLNHLGMAKAALLTTNLDADFAYMQGLGIEFLSPPATRSDGTRFAIFKDPDGTFYELREIPGDENPLSLTQITSIGPVNVNVSDFERSRAFYRMLGFTDSASMAPTEKRSVARAMGFRKRFWIEGERITFPGDGSAIEIVEWIYPFDPSPPYPAPINHFGINRLAYSTNDLQADVDALKAQGVAFLSEIAPCCSGPSSTQGIVSFEDPDGTFIELVGAITP